MSLFRRITAEKGLFWVIIIALFLVIALVIYLFIIFGIKNIEVISPNGEEEWEIGQKYEITWQSRGVDKVGIVLFNKKGEAEWIAEGVNARSGKYEFEVYKGHEFGYGFWVSVFEYPWVEDGEVDYSDNAFAITYPELSGCDVLSVDSEWPFLPDDYPNVRKVFITKNLYNGNLGGLEGADQKCRQEAKDLGYDGNWSAFIGSDDKTATTKLAETEKGVNGIFVEAEESAVLIRGATCHRLLGKSFSEFLNKFKQPLIIAEDKINSDFLNKMSDVWLGRINNNSPKNCIVSNSSKNYLPEKYSFTVTCQNWTRQEQFAQGYPPSTGSLSSFPGCYTPSGVLTNAVSLGGLKSGLLGYGQSGIFTLSDGSYCNRQNYLMCIQD